MKSLPQWSATVLLTAPLGAWALGLGDIELQSALNQPLRAEIELLSVTPEDLDGLRVGLASRAAFERYELDLTPELNGLSFEIDRNAAGRYVVRVTSRQPMTNPFLTFLVEATWPRGRLLREYTVLLDPPVFTPEIGAEPPIRQAEAGSRSDASGAFARAPQSTPAETAPSQSAPRQAGAATSTPRPTDSAAEAALASGEYGPVQSSETLWSIASRLRPAGVSVNQMMVALYNANPQAFDGNMNVLLRGATLRIPDRDVLTALSAAEATEIVRRAEESWRGTAPADSGDERLASAEPAPAGSSTSTASTDEPRLRLVPPSAESLAAPTSSASASSSTGAGSGAGSASDSAEVARLESEIAALRAELEESRRLLQIREQSLEALQARLAAAEDLLARSSAPVPSTATAPGVDLEVPLDEEPLFVDEVESTETTEQAEAAKPAPAVAESAPVAAPAATTTQPAATARSPEPEPSLLSRVLTAISNPFLLIGLGVGAVLLTAVWYLRNRREDADDVTGRWDALDSDDTVVDEPAEPTRRLRQVDAPSVVVEEQSLSSEAAAAALAAAQPKSDSKEIEDTLSSSTVINLDQGDVLAEADFHMAYGLYDQAAELVQKALQNEPHRRDLKLKLIEVYFVWGNKDAFREAASALRAETQGADPDWDKVLIMGKQLCPDDPLFAESTTGGSGEVDLELESTGTTSVDFPVEEKTQIADVDDLGLDFELAATGERIVSFDESDVDAEADSEADTGVEDMLEIGAQTAAGLEAALLSADDDDEEEQSIGSDEDTARAAIEVEETDVETALEALGDPTDVELESLAATQETPTVESPAHGFGDDWRTALGLDSSDDGTDIELEGLDADSPTMESPWPAPDSDSPTMESPWLNAPTVETPTLESPRADVATTETVRVVSSATSELPTVETPAGEFTEEIDLGDLGLSVEDLSGLPDDIGSLPGDDAGDTREQPALSADDELLSATGVTKIIDASDDDFEATGTAVLGDDDETLLAGTAVLEREIAAHGTAVIEAAGSQAARGNVDTGLDLDLDDLASALAGGDTVEQPRAEGFATEIFAADDSTPVDLDVGVDDTVEQGAVDPHTMTEIGTKLDLARAYIDMGDPDGARSILEEVLDEGDAGQRREAQGLIDALAKS